MNTAPVNQFSGPGVVSSELRGSWSLISTTRPPTSRGVERYALILDTVGNRSVPDLRGALAEGGKAAVTGFTSVAKMMGVSLRGGKDITMVSAHVVAKDLDVLRG